MSLVPGLEDQFVLDAIESTVRILAPNFTFGIYDTDDIKQEGRREALKALPRYLPGEIVSGVPTRPLENFLYTSVRNGLINLKRNKYRRTDPPCLICHGTIGNHTAHEDGQFCQSYLDWRKRNNSKANLMRPLDLEHVSDEREKNTKVDSDVETTAELNEILHLVDEELDVELRAAYLQMRAGKTVPKARREAVEAAVHEILHDALEAPDDGV